MSIVRADATNKLTLRNMVRRPIGYKGATGLGAVGRGQHVLVGTTQTSGGKAEGYLELSEQGTEKEGRGVNKGHGENENPTKHKPKTNHKSVNNKSVKGRLEETEILWPSAFIAEYIVEIHSLVTHNNKFTDEGTDKVGPVNFDKRVDVEEEEGNNGQIELGLPSEQQPITLRRDEGDNLVHIVHLITKTYPIGFLELFFGRRIAVGRNETLANGIICHENRGFEGKGKRVGKEAAYPFVDGEIRNRGNDSEENKIEDDLNRQRKRR